MPFEMNDYLKKFAEKVEALINESEKLEEDGMKVDFIHCYNQQ